MNKLKFSEKFDAIICLNANVPDKSFFSLFDVPIYASDGAGILLYRKGVIPDKVIGDLDSFYSETEHIYFPKENIIHISEQETNDFEKCLKFCLTKNKRNILIVGFHGGHLEHTLNNWSVFKRYSLDLNLCIFDNGRYGIPLKQNITLSTNPGEVISLIPQSEAILQTTGLKWELKRETLSLGIREGARNEAIGNQVIIEIISGEILLFINSNLPYLPTIINEN